MASASEGDNRSDRCRWLLLDRYLEELMRFLWVGLGGACGSVARYAVGLRIDQSHFPSATLAINVSEAFALGLFLTLGLGHLSVAVMTPVAVGVIGGFTTFSTFMWEDLTFSRTGRAGVALVYISVSVVGGLVAAGGGYALARLFR
jgi:CrcB protein